MIVRETQGPGLRGILTGSENRVESRPVPIANRETARVEGESNRTPDRPIGEADRQDPGQPESLGSRKDGPNVPVPSSIAVMGGYVDSNRRPGNSALEMACPIEPFFSGASA